MEPRPCCQWCALAGDDAQLSQFIDCPMCDVIVLCVDCRIRHLELIMDKRRSQRS